MIFEDYSEGVVLMKNGSRVSAHLNYDAANRNMMYKDRDIEMILTGSAQIDTIYIGKYKFIPFGESYIEVIRLSNGLMGINWLLKNVSQGHIGAYGVTTQAKVETLNTVAWNDYYGVNENQHTEVFKLANNNEYSIFRNGNPVTFKTKRNLLKLFPEEKSVIERFMKENKTDMKKTEDVINLINFCLGL